MVSIDISRFNNKLIQERPDFCIPTCIQGMMQFQDPKFDISQQEILHKITAHTSDKQPSFRTAEECAKIEFPNHTIRQLLPGDFREWLGMIKSEIDEGFPIAISTRSSPTTAHITLVVGYDDQNEILSMYNPGITEFNQQGDKVFYRIIARSEKLSFEDAENRFNTPNSCRDLLTIRKKK